MVPASFPAFCEPKGVRSCPRRAASAAETAAETGDAANERASSPPRNAFLLYRIVQPLNRLKASIGLYCYCLKIGRASCRDRVDILLVVVAVKEEEDGSRNER